MRELRFSTAADVDIANILDHSEREFGSEAAERYAELLSTAFLDLASDPDRIGVKYRSDLGADARIWHLAGSRDHVNAAIGRVMRPRHIVVFRMEDETVAIGRILHDSMEAPIHLTEESWE